MSYTITIDGTDRTDCIINRTVKIVDESRDKPSKLACVFVNHDDGLIPDLQEEIIVTKNGSKLFAGYIVKSAMERIAPGQVIYKMTCKDYTMLLDRNLVVEGYENMTDLEIIEDIVANYCQGTGITTTNVVAGITISNLTFNYDQPSQCFRKICEITGRTWYIDYDKDIHYDTMTTNSTPFDIDSNSSSYEDLSIAKDNTNIKNRVYVRGGTYLSDTVTIKQEADGEQEQFLLPNKPHSLTVAEDGVSKTVGTKHLDVPADYDYLLNFQEKYVENTIGAPANGTVMTFTYKYDIPILVAVEDSSSIESVGQFEFAIFDNAIESEDDARTRAQAELTDYADGIVDGSFITRTDGFIAGQIININLAGFDVNDDYIVQQVTAKSEGSGSFEYKISVASTRKIGIINFLIKLLEADKNYLEIDPNEVVDELFEPDSQVVSMSDSLASDSLITPPFQWNSMKWNLFEWS